MTTPREPPVQISNNFTEMFLIMTSAKIAQTVPTSPDKSVARARDKKYL